MTIEGYSYEGWPIHPDYQPVHLIRSAAVIDLPNASHTRRRDRIVEVVKRVFRKN